MGWPASPIPQTNKTSLRFAYMNNLADHGKSRLKPLFTGKL